MVNIGKRMRKLKPVSSNIFFSENDTNRALLTYFTAGKDTVCFPKCFLAYSDPHQLLDVRCGPGAQLLPRPLPPSSLEPPPQHPILTRLHLNVPVLAFRNSHSSSLYFW